MPLSLFLLGSLIGAVIGGYLCYCIGRDKRDDLADEITKLKAMNKALREVLREEADSNKQKRREEGLQCDPFTKF